MKECILVAPARGWVGPLAEAPDPVFASLMMGDGVLLDPTEGELRSPCDGVIIGVARTKHAVTIRAHNGAEILLHVGIETVALEGDGFIVHVQEGQSVNSGDPLLSIDINVLANRAASLVTPIVIANSDQYEIIQRADEGAVVQGDYIMSLKTVKKPAGASTAAAGKCDSVSRTVIIPLTHGLHARPAARLANTVKKFQSQIVLSTRDRGVNALSPVALMALGVRLGDTVTVSGTGVDAHEAVQEIVAQIAAGLGEMIGSPPLQTAPIESSAGAPKEPVAPVMLDGSTILTGTTGAPGLCIGAVIHLRPQKLEIREDGAGVAVERASLKRAIEKVRQRLLRAADEEPGEQGDIMKAHLALLDDPVLLGGADASIAAGKSAGFAWRAASREQAAVLSQTGDIRIAERGNDLLDLEVQVLIELTGKDDSDCQKIEEGAIVLAEDFLPSQFIRLTANNISGIASVGGGATSHVSILAASKGIASLVAVGPRLMTIPDGTPVILNADRGEMQIAPPLEKSAHIKQTIEERRRNRITAQTIAHENCFTADGTRIKVFANLGASDEAADAVKNGAEGCGLLRSEFLFLGRSSPPSEEEQLKEYQKIVDGIGDRPLVIRTLDIGGDKPAPYIHISPEENPALGMRGVRVSLQRPDLLKTQFRAILQVKSAGPIHIMLPMVIALEELQAARRLLDEARTELGVSAPASLGVMIETPASAVLADSLSTQADFFSIGTNDLTQYVLAIDRGNPSLAAQADGLHPAVLRMIKTTIEAGNASGKWVGVCGALASDLVAAPVLIGFGVTELSSTPTRLAELKAFIRTLNGRECQKVAEKAVTLHSASDVRNIVRSTWPHLQEWA